MTSIARRVTWQNLEREVFDLLVIGGGITGAGIARDAALRGLKVALVEKNDFAAGTSSKSSKLIHGGLRYLQQAELSLVFEAVSERTRLLKLAPHLVRPQRFLVPAYRGKFPGRMALNAGLLMYDALSRFSAPGRHCTYRKKALLAKEPGLRDERLTGGVTYYDSITDDARLTIENILDAKRHGAQILSYARVTGFIEGKTEGNESLISGVTVQGVIDPEQSAQVRAKVTINATGPWSDLVLRLLQQSLRPVYVRSTHLRLSKSNGLFVLSGLPQEVKDAQEVYLLIQRPTLHERVVLDDVKLSCTSRLALVHRLVLRGVPFKHVERPPFQHTFGPEVDFYQLQSGEEWEHVLRESALALYVHPALERSNLFLFWR